MRLFALAHLTIACLSVPCWANQASKQTNDPAPTDPSPAVDSNAKADSRRHFDNGVNLFEDRNYQAALAEFEAAYRQYPSASALQNIALCQKQLYRYSDARESLIRLKREHLGELEAADQTAVDDAIRELANLIGSVRVSVQPANAKITLD